MEQTENRAVVTFDTLYTNNHIQILKVLLPYFDVKSRKKLAVLIKFMELRYTMEYFSQHAALESAEEGAPGGQEHQPDIVQIFEQIKNFCTPSERAMFDQLANMKKSMEMYEEMMNMMQLFSQLNPEGQTPFSDFQMPSGSAQEGSYREAACQNDHTAFPQQDRVPDADDDSGTGSDAPLGQSSAPFGSANPMDLLKGMLSPEQQAMFEMFRSSFGDAP